MSPSLFRSCVGAAAGAALLVANIPLAMTQDATPKATAGTLSPLPKEPKTPEELFSSVLLTLQVNRPDVARRYLDAFVEASPSDEFLLALRNQYGSATFMRLARTKELQPTSQDLMRRLQQAALARVNDEAVIDLLIDQLTGTPRDQDQALLELSHLRARAVPHILRRVVSQQRAIPVELAVSTLVHIGEPTVPPLIGTLRTAPDTLRGLAAEALGRIGGKNAELALWGPAFATSSSEAVREESRRSLARLLTGDVKRVDRVNPFGAADRLYHAALGAFKHEPSLAADEDGLVGIWTWDAAQQSLIETRTSPDRGDLFLAESLARESLELSGDKSAPEVLLAAILLARDVEAAGWDKSPAEGPGTAHDLVLAGGPDLADGVLRLALRDNQPAAALGVLKVLQKNGSRSRLSMSGIGQRPAVLEALTSTEPRLQFAAAETILEWDPVTSFADSRRVVEILARTLAGDQRPDGVVIDPNNRRATLVADFLKSLGYEPRVERTGAEGFREAAEHGDVALAVVHLNSIRWELTETVSNLRADARTASLPIAIYGPVGLGDRVKHLTEGYPRVQYIEESNNATDLMKQLRTLIAEVTPPRLTETQRADQRKAAATWLAHIAEGERTKLFDLTIAAQALADNTNDPELGPLCLRALAGIPSPAAQTRILDTAVSDAVTPPTRLAATRQLAFHIERFGLLVGQSDLGRLRSFAGAETDPVAKTALTAVEGALKPDTKTVRDLLLSYPPSVAPLR